MSGTIDPSSFRSVLCDRTPIIDVRAPVEFSAGSIPQSINLPLLIDIERHEVGTIYKNKGQAEAIELGHRLVSGETKLSRIEKWVNFTRENPTAVLTCFRGGLRSRISQEWLAHAGFARPRIEGGYKAFRQFILSELDRLSAAPICLISGSTGSGKTLLLCEAKKFRPAIDLEFLAKHRGSAFGAYFEDQPSQADFENRLVRDYLVEQTRNPELPILVEDESRMIGSRMVPEGFFTTLRSSGMVLIEEPVDERVKVIFKDYITDVPKEQQGDKFSSYKNSMYILAKKLGGLRFQELLADLAKASALSLEINNNDAHKIWIEKLLVWYYDPLYAKSLAKRRPEIVFRGSRDEALGFLKQK